MKTTWEWSRQPRSYVAVLTALTVLAPLVPRSRAGDEARDGDARERLEVRSWRDGDGVREGERDREPDRPREGADRERAGAERREADRPREGDREHDGDAPREGADRERDGDRAWPERPREAERDRERAPNLEAMIRDRLEEVPPGQREETMLMLRENFQAEFRDAQRLAAEHPDEAAERIDRMLDEATEMSEQRRENPDQFARHRRFRQLENQASMLAARARESRGGDREQAMAELRKTLHQAFELKQQNLAREVEEMTQHLTELRSLLQKRQENREAIVNRRAYELVGEQDYLEW